MRTGPAFDLILACLAWPPSPARDAKVRAAAERVIDWDQVLVLVIRHRVVGLVVDALDRSAAPLPTAPRAVLLRRAGREARRDGLMTLESARLQARLDAAQIPNLVLKGATLSALAYGRNGLKQSLDIDLLILPDHVRAATKVLEDAGYLRVSPAADLCDAQLAVLIALTREAAFRGRHDNLLVELQWRVDINPLWLRELDARSPAQEARLDGAPPLRTLAPDLLYAYLSAHGARHGFARLKWLADIAALLARLPAWEIEALHARARALGVGRASSLTLRLCQDLLALDLPPALSAGLARERALRPLLALCRGFMTQEGATEAEGGRLYLYRLALLQILLNNRPDQLWEELKLRWASPRDRLALRLPPWAGFLYPVLRLPLFVIRRWRALSGRRARLPARR